MYTNTECVEDNRKRYVPEICKCTFSLTKFNSIFLNLNSLSFSGVSVPSQIQLHITLRWITTTCLHSTIAHIFQISQPFLSLCISKTLCAVAALTRQFVRFPDKEKLENNMKIFQTIANFRYVFGIIDCTHIPIQKPEGEFAEQFRCSKGFFSLNVQCVCGPNFEFYTLVCRWPGSVKDSRIFTTSFLCEQLKRGVYTGHLLGDNEYPLCPYLLTPVINATSENEVRYNEAHCATRNVIERCFRLWKRKFCRLTIPLQTSLETAINSINSAAVLFNIVIKHRDILPETELIGEVFLKNYDVVDKQCELDGHCLNNTEAKMKREFLINSGTL